MTPFVTPGYFAGNVSAFPLTSGQHLVMHLGMLPLGGTGAARVFWPMGQPAASGWCEFAIAVGMPMLGNASINYVGTVDMTDAFANVAAGVSQIATIPISTHLDPGTNLWLVVAGWSPSWSMPSLCGPQWTDANGTSSSAGLVGVVDGPIGLTRPSALMAQGQSVVFAAAPWTRPIHAMVTMS